VGIRSQSLQGTPSAQRQKQKNIFNATIFKLSYDMLFSILHPHFQQSICRAVPFFHVKRKRSIAAFVLYLLILTDVNNDAVKIKK